MPKKFSEPDKTKWLEQLERGQTEKAIAREAKCDLRTLRRGIQEARHKQEARQARIEIVKEALKKHQGDLLQAVAQILDALALPPPNQAPLSWYAKGDSIFSPNPETIHLTLPLALNTETPLYQLLKQHLKQDRVWKMLREWEKAYASHLEARRALQLLTVSLLEKYSSLKLTDQGDLPSPVIYSYTCGDRFYQAALKTALGSAPSHLNLESMTLNSANGEVRLEGLILAEAPGQEAQIKSRLIQAWQELSQAPEIPMVRETYHKLEEATLRAKRVVESIYLLGLIPGSCEICKRLGM